MAPYGGVYITHLRSEADKFLEGMDEAIMIGRKAGVPVEVYHLKAAGRRNWHKATLAIARIEAAREEGLDIGADMGKDWVDTILDLILSEQQGIGTIYFMMTDDNLKLQMQQPWIKFGTDASGVDPEKPQGLVHPRSYGTYPRILGKYVREDRTMRLEEAIRKMSSAVANRLFIKERGLIREGYYIDAFSTI